MQISIILLGKLVNFFIMILLGFILVNKNILKSSDSRILSIIVVYLVMPCAIIGSFEILQKKNCRDCYFPLSLRSLYMFCC